MITKINKFRIINESEEEIVKDDNYYTNKYIADHGMITHDSIKSEADIEELIMNSDPALNSFLSKFGYNFPCTITKSGKNFRFSSEKITDKNILGLFSNCVEYAIINNFNGGQIKSTTHEGKFYFSPKIWFTLTLSYQAISGGSNGMSLQLGKDERGNFNNNLWFDIINKKYITSDSTNESKIIKENFEVHYSDGIRGSKKFTDLSKAMSFTKKKIKDGECREIAIYKAGPRFHSTADTDAVVAWWGKGSYLDNMSKKDDKLAVKKINN